MSAIYKNYETSFNSFIKYRWVLEAMRLYQEMYVKNPKPIEYYSPFEIRKVLIKVLTVKDWGSTEEYVNDRSSLCTNVMPPLFL